MANCVNQMSIKKMNSDLLWKTTLVGKIEIVSKFKLAQFNIVDRTIIVNYCTIVIKLLAPGAIAVVVKCLGKNTISLKLNMFNIKN